MKFVNPLTETELETLQQMHRFHPSRRARLRAHGIVLSHQRYKLDDMAQILQVSRRRLSTWIDRWHRFGLVGLYDQPRSGRPPIYSAQEQHQIDTYLQRHPQNIKRMIEDMAHDTQKRVGPKTMKRYIKKASRLETHQKNNIERSRSTQIPTQSAADHSASKPRGSRRV